MTTTTAAKSGELVKADPAVAKIEQMIGQNKQQMAALLGKNISVERLFQIAMTAVSRVPKLKECTTASILGCVMESSRLRLPAGVGAGGTWLIPRKNKHTDEMECTLIIDYRAIILMMKRDADVETVVAEAVHTKDAFDYGIGASGPYLEWKPAKGDRGAVLGYVSASWNKAGKLTGVIYKTIDEIKHSNMKKSTAAVKGEGPWASDPEWMFKKSVLRPLGKLNPSIESDDLSRAIALDERADLDLPQNLHLLADPTAKPQLDHEQKTYAAPPTPTGDGPFPAEKIKWARDAAKKQGVPHEQFDAWIAAQPGDEAAKAEAATVAWKSVAAKTAKAVDVFAVNTEAKAPEEKQAAFVVSSAATVDFDGNPDCYVIKDSDDPVMKYFTDNADTFQIAKAAQKNEAKLIVKYIDKMVGSKTARWITKLA